MRILVLICIAIVFILVAITAVMFEISSLERRVTGVYKGLKIGTTIDKDLFELMKSHIENHNKRYSYNFGGSMKEWEVSRVGREIIIIIANKEKLCP